ncbi:MAG: hemophilus-specific protein [bacterium]
MSPVPSATMPQSPMPPSPPPGALGQPFVPQQAGLVRVVSPGQLAAMEQEKEARARAAREARLQPAYEELAAYVRRQFDIMRRHRDGGQGWTTRMLEALRMFNGEYEPDKLAKIRAFGGSEVYARIVAAKCRGATALLRDIYLGSGERPWAVEPTPEPTVPDDARAKVDELVAAEVAAASMAVQSGLPDVETGAPLTQPSEEEMVARRATLEQALEQALRKKAHEEAKQAQSHLDDLLVEGGFYKALSEFLMDLSMFPFACIIGPVVHMTPSIKWERGPDGKAKLVKTNTARMFWKRGSPFDLWWTPGASSVESAEFIHRERKARMELNSLLGVPGFNDDNLRAILAEYPNGYTESPDSADSTRAEQESREDPNLNESGMYDCLTYYGSVQGRLLRQFGMSAKDVPDEALDYSVQLYMIGRYVIKVVMSPSPRERPPVYITSYNKVPGTMVGNALPDVLGDIQDVCNASLRALVNNMSMASGPQVAINEDMISAGEDTTQLWPWRVWRFANRPGSPVNSVPVTFFQPQSNAQNLLGVYEKFTQIADETSAIPRYVTGSERMGGAGRTASGLAMLMGNASKMLQTVASNIDTDIFEPLLQYLYDIIMLTDQTGRLRGDERIVVKGVTVAIQRETERQRQLELLQATANPLDSQIVGMRGRGALLRAVAEGLGLDGQMIVPSDEDLLAREKQAQMAAMVQAQGAQGQPGSSTQDAAAQAQGGQTGGEETGPREIQGPRVNLQTPAPQ